MRILIADDDPVSRTILHGILKKNGHEVLQAANGQEALEKLQTGESPSLAILDWMMPGLDGLEVVRRIRQNPTDHAPYLIMLTSRDDEQSLVEGLDAGADDYLSKPYSPQELRARISVGERMLRMQETLSTHAREMEALAEARARQLIHADRMATLGVLSAGIAHEINNPATFISGNAQTLQRTWDIFIQHLREGGLLAENDPRTDFILKETPAMFAGILKGVDRISKIVRGLKGYAHRGTPEMRCCALNEILSEALDFCQSVVRPHIDIRNELPPDLPPVLANSQQIGQVFINLITNASDAMADRPRGELSIHGDALGPMVRIRVTDNGPGMPPDVLSRIFEPFFSTKKAEAGTGLGLAITRDILEAHGGYVRAASTPGRGTVFSFFLPVCPGSHMKISQGDTP